MAAMPKTKVAIECFPLLSPDLKLWGLTYET
jgi:hypothetical protein